MSGSGGQQTTQTTTQLDPDLKAAWISGPNSALANAQSVYQRHQENPYNDLQKAAISGIVGNMNGMKGVYNSGNALAAKALAGYGITMDQPQAWSMPSISAEQLDALFSPKKNEKPTPDANQYQRGLLYNGASKY